jgi:hypothetical protein
VSYAISGITAADLSAGSLTGTAVVNQVGTQNIATVSLTLADDKVAEGSETLTLTVAGVSKLLTVTDAASVGGDSGNTLATAKNMGDWTYNVPALGALQGQEFSETVGGDTDTVATVAGAIAGARDSVQAIPSRWLTYINGELETPEGVVRFDNAGLQDLARALVGP